MPDLVTTTVWHFGYAGMGPHETAAALRAILNRKATLVDVRIKPWSRDSAWTREALQRTLGPAYRWVPDLGNMNYRVRGLANVRIRALERGLETVVGLLRRGPVVLMCSCHDGAACHRQVILRALEARGYRAAPFRWDVGET